MSNQSRRQQSVRDITGTALDHNGDWHALFDSESLAAGPFNGRMLAWLNSRLSSSQTGLAGAQAAYAARLGLAAFGSVTKIDGYPAALFVNGEAGAWFDPFDRSTLFQDSAGTTPVASPGDPVGLMLDKSGRNNHATQSVSAARPIYGIHPVGGIRNLLTRTEEFDNAAWGKAGLTVTANAETAPDGTATADTVTSSDAGGSIFDGYIFPTATGILASAAGGTFSYSVYAKAGTATSIALLVAATANYMGSFNLSTGVATTSSANTTVSMTDEGNGWYRCVIVCSSVANSVYAELQIGRIASTLTFQLWGAQLETGSTATDYQRVGNRFNVTEAGVSSVHYLYRDPVDDVLAATVPDLGTAATRFFATELGVTIQGAQTIGAGAYDALRGERTYASGVINRALTTAEAANVTKFLNKRAGL
jgi:hypothetical protein